MTNTISQAYVINGDVSSPAEAERTMLAYANAFDAQATALNTMRAALTARGVEGVSPDLLAKQSDDLRALAQKGRQHAAEFARQVQIMRDKVAADPALAKTQKGGWLDPARQ